MVEKEEIKTENEKFVRLETHQRETRMATSILNPKSEGRTKYQ